MLKQNQNRRVKNAQRTIVDGIEFPSRTEAYYYTILKDKRAAGEIYDFLRQVPFELQPQFRRCTSPGCKFRLEKPDIMESREFKRYKEMRVCPLCGSPLDLVREITYVADFVIFDEKRTGYAHVLDIKSSPFFQTEIFKLKKRLFDYVYPMYHLELVYPKIPKGWKGDEKELLVTTA